MENTRYLSKIGTKVPTHYNIAKYRLEEEIRIIEEAGNVILYILPEISNTYTLFSIVTHYLIIFKKINA